MIDLPEVLSVTLWVTDRDAPDAARHYVKCVQLGAEVGDAVLVARHAWREFPSMPMSMCLLTDRPLPAALASSILRTQMRRRAAL